MYLRIFEERGNKVLLIIIIIIIIIIISTFITVSAGVLYVRQPGANHAPRALVTQVNLSVQILSTFLRIRADPNIIIIIIIIIIVIIIIIIIINDLVKFFGCDVQQERNSEFMMYIHVPCYIGNGKIAK